MHVVAVNHCRRAGLASQGGCVVLTLL
eukprot:COSAG03_NODE_11343_length_598_cov_0.859719_1_plen_26_part_10